MAKRYKLVPESLYKRFLQPDEQQTKPKPEAVFKENIPDDLKVLLYADAARDINVKQQRKRTAPIYVKSIDEPAKTIQVDRMPKLLNNTKAVVIHEFLKSHGVTYNDNMEIVINGKTIVNSVYPMMVKGLQNKGIGYQIGTNEVLDALPSLPPGVSKTLAKMQKSKGTSKQAGAGSSKMHFKMTKKPKISKEAKQTGSGWVTLK
jgi:hypothetical protein